MAQIEKIAPEGGISHFLYPGMLFAQGGRHVVTTILGSCVAVCLWDPILKVGGINHYLLPLWNGDGLPTPKFGNVSIPMLIEKMLSIGCRRETVKAKVFGGASVLENSVGLLNVGERNILMADDALLDAGISIISRDTGGNMGRKIIFHTDTGEVLLKRIPSRMSMGSEG